ncbi:tellurite resistance TerB family protein [Anderseniella sp. Alg231-50]|uniref:tellurite resistance TerB family protein n=1 Tax=Anderseniella sp. Alg231-50 TaxID=1922226 RepID=UPI00307BB81C
MDSMYRLDAIYPELRENDNAFASLIAIVWLFLVDKRIHPTDTRMLKRLYDPYIKLRGDDITFVSERLTLNPMDQSHIEWLASFLTTSITPERRAGFIRKMWTIAYSDRDLHEAELEVIRKASRIFALTDQEAEQLHEEGKAMAGR